MRIPNEIPGEGGTTGEDRTLTTAGADVRRPGFRVSGVG